MVVATRLTTPVREALLAGRKVLLIANTADALIDPQRGLPPNDRHNFPSMLLRARAGTPVGRAVDGRVQLAAHGRSLGGPAERPDARRALGRAPAPNYVLTGFPSTAFAGLVDSGMAVGWLHLAAAFTKRSFLGKALDHGHDLRLHLRESRAKIRSRRICCGR